MPCDLDSAWRLNLPALAIRLNKEIMMFDDMKPQASSEEYTISRRQAIIAIAALPTMLLTAVQNGHRSALVKQEFLLRCSASIAACWHLMAGRDFEEVEEAVTLYLPALMKWSQEPSEFQQQSADLATQGNMLLGLVSLHTRRPPHNLHKRVAYCRQAVEYGKVSGDPALWTITAIHLAGAVGEAGYPEDMLLQYQKIENNVGELSPLFRSKLLSEMARAYGYNGHKQEALRCIEQARETLPSIIDFVPIFASSDSGMFFLILMEGQTHLALGKHYPESDHYTQAWNALTQFEQFPKTIGLPERFRIEIVNQQALAAVKLGDLERSYEYLQRGIKGASTLGSEQRRREARDIYRQAQHIWPNEQRIKDLADLFASLN